MPAPLRRPTSAAVFQDDELIQLGVEIDSAVLEPGTNGIKVVSEQGWIKHEESAVCP